MIQKLQISLSKGGTKYDDVVPQCISIFRSEKDCIKPLILKMVYTTSLPAPVAAIRCTIEWRGRGSVLLTSLGGVKGPYCPCQGGQHRVFQHKFYADFLLKSPLDGLLLCGYSGGPSKDDGRLYGLQ